jgi:O-methyltransferase
VRPEAAAWGGHVAVKHLLRRFINRMGYVVYRKPAGAGAYGVVLPEANYTPWESDAGFLQVYRQIRTHTLVDVYRCYELWTLVAQSAKLEGALLEVGVWRGGTGALIAQRAALSGIREPVYLCDTFKGVVKTGAKDSSYSDGKHADTSRAAVESLVHDQLGLQNVTVMEGRFPEETAARIVDARFRFCHIDVDVYDSAKGVAEWVWSRLAVGGLIVYDDYGFLWCDGVTRYVEEQRGAPDRLILHNLNGHAVVIKIR